MKPERSLFTVLFTDIVGSTDHAAKLGDRRWRDLLGRHNVAMRRELRRFGGREVATAGDGFLALFDEPAPAILCAAAMRDAVGQIGLKIRCGLHMGSIDQTHSDVGGIGVHIAARVMGQAAPSEVLVSRTVSDAESGSEFGFEDAGVYELKGVPGEWQLFRVTRIPVGTTRSPVARRRNARRMSRRALLGSSLAVVLLSLGALYLLRHATGPDATPEEAQAAAAPGIAVMPFRVGDQSLQTWREGMVDLLSTNLDGAGGLRAIDPRTILARWREGAPEGTDPDLAATLEIARRTEAAYAVLGSAITIGPELRLTADVYDLRTGTELGEVQAAGAPDSVLALVDRLSIEILRKILAKDGRDAGSGLRLASVTTTSLPALKAYLEGRALHRRGAFDEAVVAYDRAIGADSTFAMAYYSMGEACGFIPSCPTSKHSDAVRRALNHVDRLPEREALLVRAVDYFLAGSNPYRAIELLETAIQKYPDDPEAWYWLAETLFHYTDQMAESGEDWETLAERAVQLDPAFPPYMIHLFHNAYAHADSARATEWTGKYHRVSTDNIQSRANQIAFPLAFGSDSIRARVLESIDTLDTPVLEEAAAYLGHARFLPMKEDLLRRAMNRPDAQPFDAVELWWTLLAQGKMQAARAELDLVESYSGDLIYASNWSRHYGDSLVSSALIDQALSRATADTWSWLTMGAFAAGGARWDDHASAIRRLRDAARSATVAGDSVRGRIFSGAARGLEGYGLWRSGRGKEAVALLEDAHRNVVSYEVTFAAGWNAEIRYWLGWILLELDRPQEAARYLRSLRGDPFAAYELANVEDRLGRKIEAIEAYEYALHAWQNADPEFGPRIEAARRAITRLSGAED
jgi:class 3 adenylate cyclase/tetratricopeptide (TPR) repeat protein